MRRWVCVLVLLFGFTSESYAWQSRSRPPVPIERDLESMTPTERNGLTTTPDWWNRA